MVYAQTEGNPLFVTEVVRQALAHFESALAARGDRVMDDETAALLFGLGRAQVAALARYEIEPAIANLRRAFEYYAQAGDVSRAVTVAAHPLPWSLGIGYTAYAELIAKALTLVSPDSHEAGRLLAQHGWLRGIIDADYEAAQQAFQRALTIARRQDDGALERRTLANAAFVDGFHLRWQDCLAGALQAIGLAHDAGDLHSELPARRAAAWAFTALVSASMPTPTSLRHLLSRSGCASDGGSPPSATTRSCSRSTKATGGARARWGSSASRCSSEIPATLRFAPC